MTLSKKSLRIALLANCLSIGIVSVGGPARAETSIAPAQIDRVTASPATKKNLKLTTTQPGRVVAYEETAITSKLSGFVEAVLVDIGDTVKKDQVLMRLSIPEMADEVRQKEALLAQAEAEVQQAESSVRAAKAFLETASAGIEEAGAGKGRVYAEVERAKSEYARIEKLAASGTVTNKLADEMLSQLRAEEATGLEIDAKVRSAEAAKRQAAANVEKAQADVGAAQARRSVAQANLGHVRTMIGYLEIKSPFDGVVVQRAVDTGRFVQPAHSNALPLLVVAKTDKVRVCVEVPEMEASAVDAGEKGDNALISIQSLGKKLVEGRVSRTAWGLDASNRSLRVEIDAPNTDRLLRPGMYASVSITLDQRSDVVVLPLTAIIRKEETTGCCIVKDNKIEIRPVVLGLRSGSEVEILSGVQPGEVVVMARGEGLANGQAVAVIAPVAK